MTTAENRISGRLSLPLTQNTAPVFEFNCLYSQDVRRKHKRWNDGFLKYHTFNKRVLVYDVPRNLIGDMHWLGEEDLQEGDELKLEKGGALVQVADRVGQTETDLTELRKSKNRVIGSTGALLSSSALSKQSRTGPIVANRRSVPLKNKSLNALLGTPKGPLGKAILPTQSPFDHRYNSAATEQHDRERPMKRQCVTNSAVDKVKESVAPPKRSSADLSSELYKAKVSKQDKQTDVRAGDGPRRESVMIDLSDMTEHQVSPSQHNTNISLLSSSPIRHRGDLRRYQDYSSSLHFQTQEVRSKDAKSHQALAQVKNDTRQPASRSPNNEVRAKSKCVSPEQLPRFPPEQDDRNLRVLEGGMVTSQKRNPKSSRTTASPKGGKILRLAAAAPKKKTLLCQQRTEPSARQGRPQHTRHGSPDNITKRVESDDDSRITPVQETLSQRLRKIDRKKGSTSKRMIEAPKKTCVEPDILISSEESEDDNTDMDDVLLTFEDDKISKNDAKNVPERPLPEAHTIVPSSQPDAVVTVENSTEADDSEVLDRRGVADDLLHDNDYSAISTKVSDDRRQDFIEKSYSPSPQPKYTATETPADNTENLGIPTSEMNNFVPSNTSNIPKPRSKSKSTEVLDIPGPWSREAFDLFTWRPPKWDEENWCIADSG